MKNTCSTNWKHHHLFYRVRHETILHFSACIKRAH
ncbi:hypothetical protein Asd1617_05773 [Shigella dysenteriae 1617]|uniref:Uncharacterized protein n=1 Tax=Shigella dysenteriae 1617 TaxID=754093 RepID=A0A0A7A359_SHIDY|nr:hypothetical protein Asd1617_05773 [Shigella dysenteriae 1617]